MKPLYNVNGLMFWSEEEVRLRETMRDTFARGIQNILLAENPAWQFVYFEGPLLTPRSLINQNYTNDDVWVQEGEADKLRSQISKLYADDYRDSEYQDRKEDQIAELEAKLAQYSDLVLRPETTPTSYTFAQHLLNSHSGHKPPICVWQAGKSFRREAEQPTKHMRLKEFYQQEFQCIYTADTKNDYHTAVLEPVRKMIAQAIPFPTRIVASDRLPAYSQITMDVEVWNNDKWMEVCSISRRTDFPDKARFVTKNGTVEKDILVVEIAIGLDRCVYNYNQWAQNA